jgi:hypothetical protein
MALVLAALGVSLLSTYDAEVRWLRLGSILLAIGVAMWLPAWQAALVAGGISLLSGFLRGGAGDQGILRWETLVEAPGLAAAALFTAWLRAQIAFLLTRTKADDTVAVEPRRQALRVVPMAPAPHRPPPAIEVIEPELNEEPSSTLPFHRDESLASYRTYLACLQLELTKTAQIIHQVRSSSLDVADLEGEAPGSVRIIEMRTPRGFGTLTTS